MTDCVALALQWENNLVECLNSFTKRSSALCQVTGEIISLAHERVDELLHSSSQMGVGDWTKPAAQELAAYLDRPSTLRLPPSLIVDDASSWPDILLSCRLSFRKLSDIFQHCFKLLGATQVELALNDLPVQLRDDCINIVRDLGDDANVIRLLQTEGGHPFDVDRIGELSAALIELLCTGASLKNVDRIVIAMYSWLEQLIRLIDWMELELVRRESKLMQEIRERSPARSESAASGAGAQVSELDRAEESFPAKPFLGLRISNEEARIVARDGELYRGVTSVLTPASFDLFKVMLRHGQQGLSKDQAENITSSTGGALRKTVQRLREQLIPFDVNIKDYRLVERVDPM